MRNKFTVLSVFLCLFLCFPVRAQQNNNQPYEAIVNSIKDNPQKAMEDLKTIAKTDDSAAMQYLIMVNFYQPEKINTREFEDTASRLHTKITAYYEKSGEKSNYKYWTEDGYLHCYQDLKCLIQVGAFDLSKLSGEWGKKVGKIIIPCAAAQKVHLTAIQYWPSDYSMETLNLSNCELYPQYNFPPEVEEYRKYIKSELDLPPNGVHGFLEAAITAATLEIRYDPDFKFERDGAIYPAYLHDENLQTLVRPLESWAMESYPNYMYFSKIVNHGIGFDRAVEELTRHYVKNFPVWEKDARFYAYWVMMPGAAKSLPVDKKTLRYKILSGAPADEIRALIESKKAKGEKFDEPETPQASDEILMVAIHRPDVLKILIENCAKSSCSGLDTDVNATNEFGKTALMYAAQYGFPDSVKILLDAGADINARTNKMYMDEMCFGDDFCMLNAERTALMYAVQEGNLEIARYLVENGADINLQDSQKMTVFDYLSGAAPCYGNIRIPPTELRARFFGSCPGKRKNESITAEQADEFKAFLQKNKEADAISGR